MYQFLDIQKATKLLEINKMLTKSLNLDDVLQNIIAAAGELIDVSDTLIIYLYDEQTNKLRLAEGKGIHKEKMQKIAFSPGESIAGKVFLEQRSKLFNSEEEIDLYMRSMSKENYRHYIEGVYGGKIKSAFCVPILNKNNCLGVLVVDNFKQDGVFSETDMKVIEVVADQSAIAIDNSNVYRNLNEKNALLSQSISIHNRFYNMVIEDGDINEIISLLGSIISSKVRYQSVLFYEKKSTWFPIVRGNEVLGVLEMERPIYTYSDMDKIAIEHASSSIALQLIKSNALFEKELHFREEVFNQLLEGLSNEDLQRALRYIHWDEKWNLQCIIIEGKNGPLWNQSALTDKQRFIRAIENTVNTIGVHSFIFTRSYQLIVIIPKIIPDAIERIIESIESQWEGKIKMLYGVGRETTIYDLETSYKEAIRSIGYAKSNNEKVVEYAKLGIERLLYEVEPAIIKMFMHDKLKSLNQLDTSFIETLQCFIKNNKNHKYTANKLHIHSNTLYYRLKKIEEVLHIDMNNEKQWIDLVIAMRLDVANNKGNI